MFNNKMLSQLLLSNSLSLNIDSRLQEYTAKINESSYASNFYLVLFNICGNNFNAFASYISISESNKIIFWYNEGNIVNVCYK